MRNQETTPAVVLEIREDPGRPFVVMGDAIEDTASVGVLAVRINHQTLELAFLTVSATYQIRMSNLRLRRWPQVGPKTMDRVS